MRQVAVAVCLFVSAGLVWSADRLVQVPVSPILLLPGAKKPSRLRLDVVVDGQPPTAAWEAFLDRLFDYFDRDGDGLLSRDEASRMVPLPIPGRNELTVDFAKLDADGNGKASRAELKSFCRTNGFAPVVVVVEPPSAADLRLAELLFRWLDANSDSKLTQVELRRAPLLFRKFDLNEDEFLDRAELLASTSSDPRPGKSQLRLGEVRGHADVVLRLHLGAKARTASIEGKDAHRFRLAAATVPNGLHRLHGPEGRWWATFRAVRVTPAVGSAREFLVSQFKTALGDRDVLTKDDLEQDLTLSGLRELFRYADRNADDQLSLTELEAYLKLVELGVRAQVWIKIMDRGRNPFPYLDADEAALTEDR